MLQQSFRAFVMVWGRRWRGRSEGESDGEVDVCGREEQGPARILIPSIVVTGVSVAGGWR